MQTTSDNTSGGPDGWSPVSQTALKDAAGTLLRKLLLVDDEVDGAEFAAVLLRSHGLVVIVVHSATDALQALKDESGIDVILSDITMPGMSGLQLADSVRAIYPTIKIVLMSGYISHELMRGRESHYLFVEKPYKMDNLLKVLRS